MPEPAQDVGDLDVESLSTDSRDSREENVENLRTSKLMKKSLSSRKIVKSKSESVDKKKSKSRTDLTQLKEGWKFTIGRSDKHKNSAKLATEPTADKHDPARFLGEGVSFKAKLIGVLEVSEARGDRVCQEALAELKMAIKAAGEHKQRITISIAIDGLRIRDEKTGDCLYHHPVHKISFIAQDMTDARAFGYIFGSPDTGHRFFGIKTDKAASQVVIAMRDLFQVVFELKKKEIERAKQQLEHHNQIKQLTERATAERVKVEAPLAQPEDTASATKMDSIREEVKENGEVGAAAGALAKGPEKPAGAMADLLDLEFELNNLQQGIDQMDKITPSDPFGPLSTKDPFGDSFVTQFPSFGNYGQQKNPFDSSIFNPTSMINKGYVKDPFDVNGVNARQANNKPADKYSVFAEAVSPPASMWQSNSSAAVDNTVNSQQELSPEAVPENLVKEVNLPYDVFTELDPLGTGIKKPYVDKKDFFQELKNPPKKVLNDLIEPRAPPTLQSLNSVLDSMPLFPPSDAFSASSVDNNIVTVLAQKTSSAMKTSEFSEPLVTSTSTSDALFPSQLLPNDPFAQNDPFADSDPFGSMPFQPTVEPDPFNTSFADFGLLKNKPLSDRRGSVSPPSMKWGPLRVALPPESARAAEGDSPPSDPTSPPVLPPPPMQSKSSIRKPSPTIMPGMKIELANHKSFRLQKQVSLSGGTSSGSKTLPRRTKINKQHSVDEPIPRLSPPPRVSCSSEVTPPTPPRGATARHKPLPLVDDVVENGDAPEPPPRPGAIKPPPLPPKRQQSGTFSKPPARPPPSEPNYDYLSGISSPPSQSPPIPPPTSSAQPPPSLDVTLAQLASMSLGELASTLKLPSEQLSKMTIQELAQRLAVVNDAERKESSDDSPVQKEGFSAEFEAHFDKSPPLPEEEPFDKYAVFRELAVEDAGGFSLEYEKQMSIDEPTEGSQEQDKDDISNIVDEDEPVELLTKSPDAEMDKTEDIMDITESQAAEPVDRFEDNFGDVIEDKKTESEKSEKLELSRETKQSQSPTVPNWATFDETLEKAKDTQKEKSNWSKETWEEKQEWHKRNKDTERITKQSPRLERQKLELPCAEESEKENTTVDRAKPVPKQDSRPPYSPRRERYGPPPPNRLPDLSPWDSEDREDGSWEEERRSRYRYGKDSPVDSEYRRSRGPSWDEDRRWRGEYGWEMEGRRRAAERRRCDHSRDDEWRRRDSSRDWDGYRRSREPSWDESRKWRDEESWNERRRRDRDSDYADYYDDGNYDDGHYRKHYYRYPDEYRRPYDEEPYSRPPSEDEYGRSRTRNPSRSSRRKDYDNHSEWSHQRDKSSDIDAFERRSHASLSRRSPYSEKSGRSSCDSQHQGSDGFGPHHYETGNGNGIETKRNAFRDVGSARQRVNSSDDVPKGRDSAADESGDSFGLEQESPIEPAGKTWRSRNSSQRQSPFEDDFVPPEPRHRGHSSMSISSDVSDHRKSPATDDGQRKVTSVTEDDSFETSPRSTLEDVFLPDAKPAKFVADFKSAFNTQQPEVRSKRQSPQEDIARERPRPTAKSRGSFSRDSSMRKSESVNIFQRDEDPFDDDFFSTPIVEEDDSVAESTERVAGNSADWEQAFEAFNFQQEK